MVTLNGGKDCLSPTAKIDSVKAKENIKLFAIPCVREEISAKETTMIHISAFPSKWPKDYTRKNIFIIEALAVYCEAVGADQTLKNADWWIPEISVDRFNDTASDEERFEVYSALKAIGCDKSIKWENRKQFLDDDIPEYILGDYEFVPIIGEEEWRTFSDMVARRVIGPPHTILDDLICQFATGNIPTRYLSDEGEMIDIPKKFWNLGIRAALSIFQDGEGNPPQLPVRPTTYWNNQPLRDSVPIFVAREAFFAWMNNYKKSQPVDEPVGEAISDEVIKEKILSDIQKYHKAIPKSENSQYRNYCRNIAKELNVTKKRVVDVFEALRITKGVGQTTK